MLQEEYRYREFKAFQRGNVWLYNRQVNAEGGNDYWSRGGARPDLILADLIKILHPGMAQDHEFEWYMRVPPE
jgi:iron complex transport system substrate-binding protein